MLTAIISGCMLLAAAAGSWWIVRDGQRATVAAKNEAEKIAEKIIADAQLAAESICDQARRDADQLVQEKRKKWTEEIRRLNRRNEVLLRELRKIRVILQRPEKPEKRIAHALKIIERLRVGGMKNERRKTNQHNNN